MKHTKFKQDLDSLKAEIITYLRTFFIDDICIKVKDHPEMDYPDVNGCRVLMVSSSGFHIHDSDGIDYSLEVANIDDLLSVVFVLEGNFQGDWYLDFEK